jgi:hypothetical protein
MLYLHLWNELQKSRKRSGRMPKMEKTMMMMTMMCKWRRKPKRTVTKRKKVKYNNKRVVQAMCL